MFIIILIESQWFLYNPYTTNAQYVKVSDENVDQTLLFSNYSRSLRSTTHDLRSQSEFLFTSHVYITCRTSTQLHFHWIKRGNVSHIKVITSNYVTKQLKRDWLELCDVKVLLQRSIPKPCILSSFVLTHVMWKFYYNLVFQNLVFTLICVNTTSNAEICIFNRC